MSSNQLPHHSREYVKGSDATKLNVVDLWIPTLSSDQNGSNKIWVIYIHGGAWRDPMVDSKSFEPAVHELWKSPVRISIAGFASIDYRLSPYPTHPDEPSSSDDPSRNVHYPSHLLDVSHALLYLEQEFGIDNRYILIGHSAGATMAFELHDWYTPKKYLPKPLCVLGISGIYNFEAFVENHSEIPAYKQLMDNAFPDESLWEQASPYANRIPGLAAWEHAKAIIISHSNDDELVEKAQASFMLERAMETANGKDKVHFLEATGAHDEIWESGHILAGLIKESLQVIELIPEELRKSE